MRDNIKLGIVAAVKRAEFEQRGDSWMFDPILRDGIAEQMLAGYRHSVIETHREYEDYSEMFCAVKYGNVDKPRRALDGDGEKE